MLSILVPAYHEPYLGKTLESILNNAVGEIELIPILDGWIPKENLPKDNRIKPLVITKNGGKRLALNAGIEKANGEFIMQIDAHCIVDKGFDELLTKNIQDNWLVVPRRYSINPTTWDRDMDRPMVDYHYLSFPVLSGWGFGMYARQWDVPTRDKVDEKYNIDDVLTIQGSAWVANRKYLTKYVYPFDNESYGPLAQDQQEIALKYWLGHGEIKVNKNTWYAHLSKRWYHYSEGLFSRKHKKDKRYIAGNTWGTWHWLNNKEPNMNHPFSWLIEKFSPVPEWNGNWQKEIEKLRNEYEIS